MKTSRQSKTPGTSYMKKHFEAVMVPLCFGINFPDQKKYDKITNGKIPFVKKALEISAKHPRLIPGYSELPEFMKGEQAEHDLKIFASEAKEVVEIIFNSEGSVSYIAYAYALAFYENVKFAATQNVSTAGPVYNSLKRKFAKEIGHSRSGRIAA